MPLVQKQKIQELKHKSDNNSPFSSAMQQSAAGRYSFPVNQIFNPNNESPYIDTSILRPEEREQLQQEEEQAAAAEVIRAGAEEQQQQQEEE